MSIMEYVLRSLTRACAGTSAQVVIHKVVGLPSDSFAQCVGLCLSEDCDQIRSRVMNWIASNWEQNVDYGEGVITLKEVFNCQYPTPEGGKVMIEGRDGLKEVVVAQYGQWAKFMRLGSTYPDFLFRCAVASFFKVQLIIQHLEPTEDVLAANFEAYILPVGPTRRVFLFWEELEEIWYWGHEAEHPCLPGCGGLPSAIKVDFAAPDIVSGAPSGKKVSGALPAPVVPFVTYVRARGYPRPACSIRTKGVVCAESVWVHLSQGVEAESFFESFAAALNEHRAGSSMPLRTTCNEQSIKRDLRAYIGANKDPLAKLFKSFYDDVPGAGMVLRAVVAGCEDEVVRFKPKDVSYWVSFNMTGQYHHDYTWFVVVGNCFNVQFIVVNECGMHPAI